MYLVDTNVLSEARRGNVPARDWLRSVDPETIHLIVITLDAVLKGIAPKPRPDPRAARASRTALAIAAGGATAPPSPIPFMPYSVAVAGWCRWPILIAGNSKAPGRW